MRRAFRLGDLSISVEASEEDLDWLTEFLSPAFSVTEAQGAAAAQAWVRLAGGLDPERGDRSAPAAVAFAFDSGPVRLPTSRLPDGVRLHHLHRPIDLDVTTRGSTVRVRHDGHAEDARVSAMRVVREYAHNRWLHGGGLVFHAAAITAGESALAIAGAKGAGKTTLLLALLGLSSVDYLSNDRLLVDVVEAPVARSAPTIVSLHEGTRHLLPNAARRLADSGDYRETAARRASRGPSPPLADQGIWRLGPAQLCAALERRLVPAATLAAMLFLENQPAPRRGVVHRLEPAAASRRLAEATLCAASGVYASEVFVTDSGPRPDALEIARRCAEIALRVPCFASPSPDPGSPGELEALIERCLTRS
jgi:hypothetical protein